MFFIWLQLLKIWPQLYPGLPQLFSFGERDGDNIFRARANPVWDAKGVLQVDYHTMTRRYYADLMRQLHEKVKETRHGKLSLCVLFQQDNAAANKSTFAVAAIQECGFQLVKNPSYSPHLAPSDYHLFPKMKKELTGHYFCTDDDVKQAVEVFL